MGTEARIEEPRSLGRRIQARAKHAKYPLRRQKRVSQGLSGNYRDFSGGVSELLPAVTGDATDFGGVGPVGASWPGSPV